MKKINVTRSVMPNVLIYFIKLYRLWFSKQLTNYGFYHRVFERDLSNYLDNENIVLYSNGHLALESAIRVMGLTGRIITTPFTFPSTIHAITRLNLEPVFCDISRDDFTIDVDKIESLIDEKVSAIIAVHVYGNICNLDKLEKLANKYNIKLIFDAAHSFGIIYNNKSISHYGDASMFSFHAAKVFHSAEGGMLSFKDSDYKIKFNLDQNFGIKNYDEVLFAGGNAKMNEFQALMGLLNLKNVNKEIKKRRNNTKTYIKYLSDLKGLRIVTTDNLESNYSYFVIQILDKNKSRDHLNKLLNEFGYGSRKYFFPLATEYECYQDMNFYKQKFEVASWAVDTVLALPLYGSLSSQKIKALCKLISQYMET